MPTYPHTTQKTISYDSPSGSINIGKWVPPFKSVTGGFGFVGVLAEDTGTGRLQCHVCGKWYELLTTHAWAAHGLKTGDYQETYGLSRSTVLKAMRIRKIQSAVIQQLQKQGKMALGNNLGKSPITTGNKHAANRLGKGKSVETQNRFGVCDLQVADKIMHLQKKLNRTPTLTEVIDEYGGGLATIIHSRYGGYLKLVRILNMIPSVSSFSPKFSREYFIDVGVRAVKSGQPLIANRVLSQSESRHLYRFFKGNKDWVRAVLSELSK